MVTEESRAIVVGGGIGGLAAALALQRAGWEATVFERSGEQQELGTGLHIWINGTEALRQLGVLDAVRAAGTTLTRLQWRTWRDKELVDVSLGDGRGPAVIGIARPALLAILRANLQPGTVQSGMTCVGFGQDGPGVTVRFANGREERGRMLIGADGLRSAVRGQLLESLPRYAGYHYLRAIIPSRFAALPGDVHRHFWGRGARFGFYSVGGDAVTWYAVLYGPAGGVDGAAGRKASMLERFRGWPQPVEAALEATPEEAIQRVDIYDLAPLPRWGEGSVTLLGDAAHAATPGAGRGAGEAIEDAVALAQHVAGQGDPAAAVRAYEAERMPPTAKVIGRSRSIGALGRRSSAPACALRDLYIRRMYGPIMKKAVTGELARSGAAEADPTTAQPVR